MVYYPAMRQLNEIYRSMYIGSPKRNYGCNFTIAFFLFIQFIRLALRDIIASIIRM